MRKLLLIILFATLLTLVPLTLFWLYSHVVTGLNPFLGVIVAPFSLLATVIIYGLLYRTFRKLIHFTPGILFTIALSSNLIFMLLLKIFYAGLAVDFHLHDTYIVLPYFYPLILISLGFAVFALVYHFFTRLFKTALNSTLGYIHFWITFSCTCFLLWPAQLFQIAPTPGRHYDYGEWGSFDAFAQGNAFISGVLVLLIIGQLIFAFNICKSLLIK